ncbi:hypothetical protein [Amycolatopsis jiangsuensis]|uniref:Uncharacterized protein n=1 Tax=Amycolatopsis jiangsuensis TaxID=1181879 RepID=A0A840J5Y6_9PSEU|nr:hypothetical protein [Amycolatopsis jiangsuensis]MBB4689450.1 hypothetical protein [Amycolatopsis jiangsuensis]
MTGISRYLVQPLPGRILRTGEVEGQLLDLSADSCATDACALDVVSRTDFR